MGLELEYIDGQTPLDDDEKEGLLIKNITTRGELDEFEQLNIEKAIEWTMQKRWTAKQILTIEFIQQLHSKMFGDVWRWAGTFRKTNKNLGVEKEYIALYLQPLLDDGMYWITHQTYSPAEIAIRIKHRVVQIHCFANGNGRHSRLLADIIIQNIYNQPTCTWGRIPLGATSETRRRYINALHLADTGDINPLIEFAAS